MVDVGKKSMMWKLRCDDCGAEVAAGDAVCGRCGATGPGTLADRMAPSPYGSPVARLRPTVYGPPALASAHDALQQETRQREAIFPPMPRKS